MATLSTGQAREIAREAYLFLYPVVETYRVMFYQAAWPGSPRHVAPFNAFGHTSKLLDHRSDTIVSPNNDTLYSVAWLDLRAGPVVLSTPAVLDRRYCSLQLVDGYTHNVAILSPRTTGSWEAARYIIAGPRWKSERSTIACGDERTCTITYLPLPADLRGTRVIRAESDFMFALGRTQIYGPEDVGNVRLIQRGFSVTPLSALIGTTGSDQFITTALVNPPTEVDLNGFPPVMPGRPIETESFFTCANFMLQHLAADDQDPELRSMLSRFEQIGVVPGKAFNLRSSYLAEEVGGAICEGVEEAHSQLDSYKTPTKNGWSVSPNPPMFGTRVVMSGRYFTRALAAHVALYGLDPEEAAYYVSEADVDGEPLDGSKHNYELRFAPGQLPALLPGGFWSLTVYHLPARLLVRNAIGRYSIGDRTRGVVHSSDGSLTVYLQSQSPSCPRQMANWLPVPFPPEYSGKFALIFRVYWPDKVCTDPVTYVPQPVLKAGSQRSKL